MTSTAAAAVPDSNALTRALSSVFGYNGAGNQAIRILNREKNIYESASFSEIVTCALHDGSERVLLCKYQDADERSWSDVAYEAEVYRRIVKTSRLTVPKYYGSYVDAATGRAWIFMEYLDDSVLLSEKMDPEAMALAARWLGEFHAEQEQHLDKPEFKFLKLYDAEFYTDCARRAVDFAGTTVENLAWLPALCQSFEELAARVFAKWAIITHGDYFIHNLLWRDEKIYPIDWEFAAIDLGEMDLACLTRGWADETVQQCELEYQKARWPEGSPADFPQTLGTAKLCLYFYNLGTKPNWTNDPDGLWYSRLLQRTGAQMGLI